MNGQTEACPTYTAFGRRKCGDNIRSMIVRCAAILALAASLASSQSFESVEIQLDRPGMDAVTTGGIVRGGRYELHRATVLDLIATAWSIPRERVIGGPDWLEKDRFNISAKTSPDTPQNAIPPMLQTLLRDRFHLKIHNDTKSRPALALTVSKRERLKSTDGSLPDGCRLKQESRVVGGSVEQTIVACGNVTMDDFAVKIPAVAGNYATHEVVNQTGLDGAWDFTIAWTSRQLLGIAGDRGVSFPEALNKQLGLTLEEKNVAMPVLVVDDVLRIPDGATQNATPMPTEFEAADIKPSEPGTPERANFLPGGRIDFRAVSLKALIGLAWSLHGNDEIPGLPEEIGAQRYTITAKAPAATMRSESGAGPPMDIDALRAMMRSMLADRFHLTTHYEEQKSSVYVLTAVRPKLMKADPDNRSGCKQSLGDTRSGSTRISTFSYSCTNATMAQFVDTLQQASMADLTYPIVNSTELQGAWDFTLTWTPRVLAPKSSGDQTDAIAAPVPGLTLEEALEKQLGLKLELQKRAVQVLVIDHVDSKPTDN